MQEAAGVRREQCGARHTRQNYCNLTDEINGCYKHCVATRRTVRRRSSPTSKGESQAERGDEITDEIGRVCATAHRVRSGGSDMHRVRGGGTRLAAGAAGGGRRAVLRGAGVSSVVT